MIGHTIQRNVAALRRTTARKVVQVPSTKKTFQMPSKLVLSLLVIDILPPVAAQLPPKPVAPIPANK